ncbi:MAG: hypothetical protein H0W87_03080 [Actinobacteria bacterium]|nr:hypothetical protein [Actinomycetota bacterium]
MRFALVAVAALVLASPAAAAPAKMKSAQLGPVRATISWQSAKYFQAKGVQLRIDRDGQTVLTRKLGPSIPQAIRIRDLDGNGEGEVIADFYTGGAHCCTFSLIYRYAGSGYVAVRHMWGDPSYWLRDLEGDRVPEFVTGDDRFAYAFTSYAGSALPVEVWSYRAGRMTDVTRSFPALVRKDAATLWKEYLAERKGTLPDLRGILAAWMADQYLLGHQAKAWPTLQAINRRGELNGFGGDNIWARGNAYLAKLKKFLTNHGYARIK